MKTKYDLNKIRLNLILQALIFFCRIHILLFYLKHLVRFLIQLSIAFSLLTCKCVLHIMACAYVDITPQSLMCHHGNQSSWHSHPCRSIQDLNPQNYTRFCPTHLFKLQGQYLLLCRAQCESHLYTIR